MSLKEGKSVSRLLWFTALSPTGFEVAYHSRFHKSIIRMRDASWINSEEAWTGAREFVELMGYKYGLCPLCQKKIEPPVEVKDHKCL